ncbi:hypothetical protein F4Y93_06190 [Candidatus Poribacteria bacterium]|nr:hypothetical protein [Candidatus Poribacteria bacterium]
MFIQKFMGKWLYTLQEEITFIQKFMGKWLYTLVDSGAGTWYKNGLACPACGSTDTYDSSSVVEVDDQETVLLMCGSCKSVTGVFVDGVFHGVEVDDV